MAATVDTENYDKMFKSGLATYLPSKIAYVDNLNPGSSDTFSLLGDYEGYDSYGWGYYSRVEEIRRANLGLSYSNGVFILSGSYVLNGGHPLISGFHPAVVCTGSGHIDTWFKLKTVRTTRCDDTAQVAVVRSTILNRLDTNTDAEQIDSNGVGWLNEVSMPISTVRVSADEGFVTLWCSRSITSGHTYRIFLFRKPADGTEPLLILDSWGYNLR